MVNRDPFDELFPAAQPRRDAGSVGLMLVLAAILIGLMFYRNGAFDSFGDRDRDHQEQRDDKQDDRKQDKQSKPSDLSKANGYMIMIHERQPLSAAHADMIDIAKEVCAQYPGLSYRSVDDEDDSPKVKEMIAEAKKFGVDPPCVLYRDESGDYKNAIKFPTTRAELERVVK